MPLFEKILIANRGEIAVRIMRACRELGIAAVAVYSEADANALHVRMADEAILLGAAEPSESYLNVARILEAARESGAQAIHPGYGFLAENAAFAAAVQNAGLAFIGPDPGSIRAMGDKAAARALMRESGVPVVPGYEAQDDDATLAREAGKIGYPLLVKAAAGGGGKGMRVVQKTGDLDEALGAARREARNAFGDERLILEKYIPQARHVEFQILADRHGKTLHLFERECSVQRRHQKVIEESPSPLLDDALREKMAAAAVAAAQAAKYANAGTVEFIVDPESREFYFLEMNTRLQVEHPVSELVTGLDLVQWQVRIAAGKRLPFRQDELSQRGHAIECRLYAEDPAGGFLPATGALHRYAEPSGPGIRVDSGVEQGAAVTPHYDPLLAKVIAYGEDREAAIRRMQAALRETVALGVTTNRAFLLDALAHPVFLAGQATTSFIDEHFDRWGAEPDQVPAEALIAAALSELLGAAPNGADANMPATDDPYNPWARGSGFRMGTKS
jgi:acetyl-CoA carboxylase biotin carboxylase subunit